MFHQETRQPQAGPGKKPGACACRLCAIAPNAYSIPQSRDRPAYPGPSPIPSPHSARRPEYQPQGKTAAGKGRIKTLCSRARIQGPATVRSSAGAASRLSDPAQCRIIVSVRRSTATLFDLKGNFADVDNRYYVKWTDNPLSIKQLQGAQLVGNCDAVRNVRCNKGARTAAGYLGIEHGSGPGMDCRQAGIARHCVAVSDTYARPARQHQSTSTRPAAAIRRTRRWAVHDRIPQIGRKNRSLTPNAN